MCQSSTKLATTSEHKSTMVSPYQSYMEMLLPLVEASIRNNSKEEQVSSSCSSGEETNEVIIRICFDNARPLADQASMTMRSRQRQKEAPKICRWSSTPDLLDVVSLKVASAGPRSVEDLRSLMTQNSRPARSSDSVSKNKNDRWHIVSSSQSPSISNSVLNRKRSPQSVKKVTNPFDLSMPGLAIPTPPITASGAIRQQKAKVLMRKSKSIPDDKCSNSVHHHLKVPQRKLSIESDSILKSMLDRFERTDPEM